MKVLVINSGSSSLKEQLIDCESGKVLAKVLAERLGSQGSTITYTNAESESKVKLDIKGLTHETAISKSLKLLQSDIVGVIGSIDEIDAIGHRVVHGGQLFVHSMVIDDTVLKGVEKCNSLAPLHNPACLMGIKACVKYNKPMVAVFDTAFHQTISKEKFLYPIPQELYEKYDIRKYGFHGISHSFLSESLKEIIGNTEMKCINFHLGQGASLCAIKDGKSIDTTMGISPLSGIIMGTRSGDIDPALVAYIAKCEKQSIDSVINETLNKKSGLLALSRISADMRDIYGESEINENCKLALNMFYENVAEYAAKLVVALRGTKQFVFSGGIGENAPYVRSEICKRLSYIAPVEIDEKRNKETVCGKSQIISTSNSEILVIVIPTNEELMIARETQRVLS